MSYTWTNGELITAAKLNSTGGGYDAVIRLVHANNSGYDVDSNLTPSIISGTFDQLYDSLDNGGCPCILVEYEHPYGIRFSAPMAYVTYFNNNEIVITVAGFSPMANSTYSTFGRLIWDNADGLQWE